MSSKRSITSSAPFWYARWLCTSSVTSKWLFRNNLSRLPWATTFLFVTKYLISNKWSLLQSFTRYGLLHLCFILGLGLTSPFNTKSALLKFIGRSPVLRLWITAAYFLLRVTADWRCISESFLCNFCLVFCSFVPLTDCVLKCYFSFEKQLLQAECLGSGI